LLTTAQAAKIDALKGASPDFAAMRQPATQFRGVLRSKDIQKFDVWLNEARQSGINATRPFARTVRRDIDAVRNALTEGWSNAKPKGKLID
jgi:transposase